MRTRTILVFMLVSTWVLFGALGLQELGHVATLKSRLDASHNEILELEENLSIAKDDLSIAKKNLSIVKDDLSIAKKNLSIVKDDLRRVRGMRDAAENELSSLKSELQLLRKGDRYTLHDPTYKEVSDFVKEDKTDENEWMEGEYNCMDFAADFNKNAMEKGLRCAHVTICFEEAGHRIAAFDTVDRGLVYVDPECDVIFPELEVGQEYWKIVERYSSQQFIDVEDTIQRIVINW